MEKTTSKRYGRKFLIPLLFAGLLSNSCNNSDKNAESPVPNILFILADDLGWAQLGAYGSDFYETANIDKLAAEGLRFTNAYSAAAVCSPTRASIMTGKYPARLGLTDFIPGNDREDYKLEQPSWQMFLPLDEYSLAEMFKDAGYSTAMFGKWHLSTDKRPPGSLSHNPDKQGFDEYFITYKPTRSTDPEGDPHNTDTITNLSLDFIERKKDSAFFLFMSFNAIHDPLMESEDRISEFKKLPSSQKPPNHPVVAAMLHRMDENIGRVISRIEELELDENTLIIFYSDNGGKSSYADQDPFRKGKGWLYEGGIRVPLIMKWKGQIPANDVSDEMVISNDFFPTLASVIGADVPFSHDGENLWKHISEGDLLPERDLYWHYPHYHRGSGMLPASALRSGNYKLVEWLEESITGEGNALELYNLENDPGESINLADSLLSLRDSLYFKLQTWRENVEAGMPVVKN